MKVITEEYRKLQQELHQNPNYGVASLQFAPIVANIIKDLNVESLSDYGAGKKNLLKGLTELGINLKVYQPYDPAFPEYGEPKAADLVCCIDVLEHIEPELIENVIQDLANITIKFGFFSVHMGPAVKVLADGRNAHLIQKPSSWWLEKFIKHSPNIHKIEFIDKIKTDKKFSERWGLKIEERELSEKERIKLAGYEDVGGIGQNIIRETVDMDNTIPRRAITVTYNNETIEVYE